MLPQSNSFNEFIVELKASIDRHMLPSRSIDYVFSDDSIVPPGEYCRPPESFVPVASAGLVDWARMCLHARPGTT